MQDATSKSARIRQYLAENPELNPSQLTRKLMEELPAVFTNKEATRTLIRRIVEGERVEQGNAYSYNESKDGATVEGKFQSSSGSKKLILDGFLSLAQVDLSVFDVDRYTINAWDVTMKLKKPTGHVPKTSTNYQVKVWLKRKSPLDIDKEQILLDITEQVKQFSHPVPLYKYPPIAVPAERNVFIPCLFDIHIGRLSWKEEVLVDYDLKIARENYLRGFHALIGHSVGYKIDKIIFPVGNDLFNFSIPFPYAQTDNGTYQESDGRWQKVFRIGQDLIIESVQILSSIAPVEVVIIPGNHDTLPVFFLGELLNAIYHNNKNVTIDHRLMRRKYLEYGENLFGFSHGNKESERDWHAIMAAEQPQAWGRTKYRYVMLGHRHHERNVMQMAQSKGANRVSMPIEYNVDYKGVLVEYMPSMAYQHEYEHSAGYVGTIRAAKAFIHNSECGRIAQFTYNLPFPK